VLPNIVIGTVLSVHQPLKPPLCQTVEASPGLTPDLSSTPPSYQSLENALHSLFNVLTLTAVSLGPIVVVVVVVIIICQQRRLGIGYMSNKKLQNFYFTICSHGLCSTC